jgi:hypothetical protein
MDLFVAGSSQAIVPPVVLHVAWTTASTRFVGFIGVISSSKLKPPSNLTTAC